MPNFTKPLPGARLNLAHPLSQGLVGWWLFNEGSGPVAADLSTSNIPGALINMTPKNWVGSPSGGTLEFIEGDETSVDLGDPVALQLPTHISISARFFLTIEPPGSQGRVISKKNATTGDFWGLMIQNTYAINFRINGANGNTPTGVVTLGKWHDVVCIYDGVNRLTYVDGALLATIATTGALSTVGQVSIGRHFGNPSRFFPGFIDDVRIYDRALSALEVQQLYTNPYANVLNPSTYIFGAPNIFAGGIMAPYNLFLRRKMGLITR